MSLPSPSPPPSSSTQSPAPSTSTIPSTYLTSSSPSLRSTSTPATTISTSSTITTDSTPSLPTPTATPPLPHPQPSTTPTPSTTTTAFTLPAIATFPPFYTLQPMLSTRLSQLASWSSLLLSHAQHTRTFLCSTRSPLFTNAQIARTLKPEDAREVLRYMVERRSASWSRDVSLDGSGRRSAKGDGESDEVYLWYVAPEDWARRIGAWVEETGQVGSVLTFYELLEGDRTAGEPFHGLPAEMARACLRAWERRGKCVIVGEGGVKFL